MTTLAVALVFFKLDTPMVIDSSIAVHKAMDRGSAQVRVASKNAMQNISNSYKVKYVRPDQIELEVTEPPKDGQPQQTRVYFITGDDFYGYDPAANEYLVREVPAEGHLAAKFAAVTGGVEDAVQYIVDPRSMESLLLPLKKLDNWRIKLQGGKIFCTRKTTGKGQKTETLLRFDQRSRLLESAKIVASTGIITIDYKYGKAPKGVMFVPPKDAEEVDSFYLKPRPPVYASKKARAVAEAAQKAYQRLKHVAYTVQDEEGTVKSWLSGSRMKEQAPNYEWSYDGSHLYLVDHVQRTFYKGPVRANRISELLAQAGTRIDPLLKSIANRRNPINSLFTSDLTVRVAGEIEARGKATDIIEGKAKGVRITANVLRDSKLLTDLRVENLDMKGKLVADSSRHITYTSVGKPFDREVFTLGAPSGYRNANLQELASKIKTISR